MDPGALLRRSFCLVFVPLLGACATGYLGPPPIQAIEPAHGYRFVNTSHGTNTNSLLVVMTFSGGGTRAAALAYGVLEHLGDTQIEWEGQRGRLLDEVDVISAVSGGSVTAAYYALYGDRIFDDFETRFLHRNVQGTLVRRVLAPWNWPRLASPNFSIIDLFAEYLDETLFSGATFGDVVSRNRRPFVSLNATDLATGARFEFIQSQFDLMCADLDAFPISRAVAASSAFPIVFNAVKIRNRAGNCGYREAAWVEPTLRERKLSSRWFSHAKFLRSYLGADARQFIYLTDGGVSDNLGLRGPLDLVSNQHGAWNSTQYLEIPDVRRVVFIIVNASRVSEISWKHRGGFPSFLQLMQAAADIPVDRYSFETKELLRANLDKWASDIRAHRKSVDGSGQASGIDFYLVDVDFEALHDSAEREFLRRQPTSLSLPPTTVDRIRKSARKLFETDAEFNRLLQDIDQERDQAVRVDRITSP